MQDIITKLKIRCVKAPLAIPHKTAIATLEYAPLVLLDIVTKHGLTGKSYVFVYTDLALAPVASLLKNIESLIVGQAVAPATINKILQGKFRLLGLQGFVGIAIAAIDMAVWDCVSLADDKPLVETLGGTRTPQRVYDSLGQMSPDETKLMVEKSLKNGFRAFKIKAGHPDPQHDLEVIKAIKQVADEDIWLAIDFNQAFNAPEAISRMHLLDQENLAWIEEPVLAEDFINHAKVRQNIKTPVQTGENWWGIPDMSKSLAAKASDLAMPDMMKIGGVSGWLEAASLAKHSKTPVSSHLFSEYSAHLLAVTPTAHMLEWLDISSSITAAPLEVKDGYVTPHDMPGVGLIWDEKAISKYEI